MHNEKNAHFTDKSAWTYPASVRNERIMAEMITLRAYLNELESMVENESPTEVVSHCRYLLQHYPQNVATYRLLGKALLRKGHNEGLPEHFVQAADVFQRVLSVVPDDAIAHIALSEIREQEGALGQAIWHLERAQDQLPGNAVLNDALHRLYSQQTGRERGSTGKLQLTRGALARQYANSQLYDQAILELRYALQSTPGRVDLQILLAKLLWESQHQLEAGEVAVEILKTLPYCLEANALMARLWLAYGRPSDAQPYLDQVEALDPYAAMAILRPGDAGPDPNRLERLNYTARAAATLSAEMPEWVHDLDDLDTSLAPPHEEDAFAARSPSRIDIEAVFGGGHEPGDQPDWMRDFLAPDEEEAPDWYGGTEFSREPEAPPTTPLPADWLPFQDEAPPEAPGLSAVEDAADVPDWFAPFSETGLSAEDSAPAGWLGATGASAVEFDASADMEQPVPSETQPEFPVEDEAWAPERVARAEDEPRPVEDDWLSGLGSAVATGAAFAPQDAEEQAEPFDWLSGAGDPETAAPSVGATPEASAEPDRPDWLADAALEESAPSAVSWLDAATAASERGLSAPTGDDDDIANLDRLFDALNAAEAAGAALDVSEPEAPPAGLDAEATLASAPPDPGDWMALFDQPEAEQGTTQPEPPAFDDQGWGLLLDEERSIEEADEALPEAPAMFDEPVTLQDQPSEVEPGAQGETADLAGDWLADFAELEDSLPHGLGGEVETREEAPASAEPELDWLSPESPFDAASGQVEAVSDQELLSALSLAASDSGAEDDWPISLEGAVKPEDEAAQAAAGDILPEDDILAIFGEATAVTWAQAGVDEPAAALPVEPMEQALPLSEEDVEVDWPESETDQPVSEGDTERPALFGLAHAVQQAQQEEVPDWMAGLEISVPGPEDEGTGELLDEAYDPFEGGDPSNVPVYESAGHTGILQPNEEPDWMRAFTGELAPDEEDEPEIAALDFSAANLVDEEPEDALLAFDAAALVRDERPAEPAPPRPFDALEWDLPGDDFVLGIEPEQRVEAEAAIPDWLSAITRTTADEDDALSEAVPEPTPLDAGHDAAPEWLREVDELAAEADWIDEQAPEDVAFATVDDFPDTLASAPTAAPSVVEEEDGFDGTFSFADRLPTWLRRATDR
jgi:tetratricopeptide (TPR) repeat protein